MTVFVYAFSFLAAQAMVLGAAIWIARRFAGDAAEQKARSGRAKPRTAVAARELHQILLEADHLLTDHAQQLGRFQETLEKPPAVQQADDLDSSVRDVHRANQRVDRAFDAMSSRLAEASGEEPTAECPDFEAYREKTWAFDRAIGEASGEQLLTSLASKLLDMVRELRQENVTLREEVVAAKEQVIEHMSRAHAAEQIARVDALTQLPNRRAFDEWHARCQAALERHGEPFSLVLFDLDHFKTVNDRYGHAAGDAVLAMIGRLFRETQRTSDCACRLGGEEFAVLLCKCDEAAARAVAERYRQKIESAILHYQGETLSVTASGGVAEAAVGEAAGRLLARADAALYAAKSGGRNRVCCDRTKAADAAPAAETVLEAELARG